MNENDLLRAVLRWAAGADVVPRFDGLADERVLRALRAHRLEGRLLERAENARAGLVPAALLDAVRAGYAEIEAQTAERIELTRQLTAAVAERTGGDRLVVLKGCTRYALTGARYAMRYSLDIDAITQDLPGFVETARQQGFTQHGPTDQLAEYAVLTKPGPQVVELHSHYPVTGFDVAALEAVEVRGRPAPWRVEPRFSVRRMERDFLVAHAVPAPFVDGIFVLRPELAVVVNAAHTLVDLLRYPFPLEVGTIRLDEVATVVDYTRDPAFDWDLLAVVAERFDAYLALDTMRLLARQNLGTDPFENRIPQRYPGIPRDLWWDGIDSGFPAGVLTDTADLVVRDIEFPDFLRAVGGGPAVPAVDALELGCGTVDRGINDYFFRAGGDPFPVTVSFAAVADGVDLTVSVPAPDASAMTGVSLYFAANRFEFFWANPGKPMDYADYSFDHTATAGVTYRTEDSATSSRLRVYLPWSAVGGVTDRLAVLFAVRHQRREWGEVTAGAVLPVVVEFAGASRALVP